VAQRQFYVDFRQKEDYGEGEDWETRYIRGPIRPIWWDESRIHLTDNSGDHVMLDLEPAEGGSVGQIISHSHEVGPQEVLAPSLVLWLTRIAEELETGRHFYDAEEMTVMPV
jgi:cell wall assembly regulator SMI1